METQTIDASVQSARDSLMASIGNKTDWSGYKDNSASSTPSATDNATLNTDSQDRGASEVTDSSTNKQEVPSQEANTTKNSSVETVANPTDTAAQEPIKQAKPSRENARVRELVEKQKATEARALEAERKLQEAEAAKSKEPSKPQEPKALVPKPQIARDYLEKALEQQEQAEIDALTGGDKDAAFAARANQKKIQGLIQEHDQWDSKNGEAVKQYNAAVSHYREAALKEVEALKDPASPVTQEYTGIRGWLNQNFPELLEKPVAEYFLAKVADWKHTAASASARLATSETELKSAREEIERLKKGSLPITTSSKPDLGGNNSPDSNVKDAKRGLMDSIRNANLGMTM